MPGPPFTPPWGGAPRPPPPGGPPPTLLWVPLLGLLPALAHPPVEWDWAAWVALAPLVAWIRLGTGSPRAWCGAAWGWGLVYYSVQLHWLPHALLEVGGAPWPAFVGLTVGAVAVLALYPAAAIALSRWAWQRWAVAPVWSFPVLFAVQEAALGVTPFGGAPWGSLAATQVSTVGAAAVLPALGAPGLVALIAAGNAAWSALPRLWASRPGAGAMATIGLTLATFQPAMPAPPPGERNDGLRAVLVPGDLPVGRADAGVSRERSFRYYLGKTAAALQTSAADTGARRLVIWPESAVEGHVEHGKLLVSLFGFAALLDADFLLGSDARERGREHNSAYLLFHDRFHFERYDKRRLVPFGEYVPTGFGPLFGRTLTSDVQDYAPGGGPPVLNWRGVRLGLAICFESILPAHALAAARAGAELLVVLSNDRWLTGPARRQHLLLTALRGMEIGREVLVAANGGWSAHLAGGRAEVLARWNGSPVGARPRPRSQRTPWVRWGHAGPGLLLAAYVLGGAAAMMRQRRSGAGGRGWPGGAPEW